MSNETQIDKIADYLKQIKEGYIPIEIKVSDVLENAKDNDAKYYITDFHERTGTTNFCIIDENEYGKLKRYRKTGSYYDNPNVNSYFWFSKDNTNTKEDRIDFAKMFIHHLEMKNVMMENE